MDILKTELVWIDNRCYRKLPIKGAQKTSYFEEDMYPIDSKEYRHEEEVEEEKDDLPIIHDGENRFWISITVPGPLIGVVIGKQAKRKQSIESSTNTEIKFPNERQQYGRNFKQKGEQSVDAVISGKRLHSVADAYRRIERIINDMRFKMADYTHFISIPMNSDAIQKGFLHFQEDVLARCKSARGMSAQLFEYPMMLHLTISMLTLFDDKEKELAKGTLNKCRGEILELLGDKTLQVEVKGIEYMNDDPAEVDVLYGKVRETDGDNLLQMIADKLEEAFVETNLAQKEYESVKLHVTLMKSRSTEGQRNTFDARPILKMYSDYKFGEMRVEEIHVSTRFTGTRNRYYITSSLIRL